jgi:hypothetical protein
MPRAMERTNTPLDLATPRSMAQLLTTTLALFRAHAGLFLSATLLVVAPAVLLVDGVWGRKLREGPNALPNTGVATVSLLLSALVIPSFVTALHAVIVRRLGERQVPSVGESLREVAPRLPAALGAVVLHAIGTLLGLLMLLVPGIWIAVRWYFAAQAAVLDGTSPVDSLRRSAELVDGRWWEVFAPLLLSGVLFGGALGIGQALATLVHAGVPYVVLLTLLEALSLSLSALFGTLLFFTLRARQRDAAAPPVVAA